MDWRDRKYYVVRFSPDSYDMRIRILKNIEGVKLYSSTNHKINTNCDKKIYVMGIASEHFHYDDEFQGTIVRQNHKEWRIRKVKGFEDLVDGEK